VGRLFETQRSSLLMLMTLEKKHFKQKNSSNQQTPKSSRTSRISSVQKLLWRFLFMSLITFCCWRHAMRYGDTWSDWCGRLPLDGASFAVR